MNPLDTPIPYANIAWEIFWRLRSLRIASMIYWSIGWITSWLFPGRSYPSYHFVCLSIYCKVLRYDFAVRSQRGLLEAVRLREQSSARRGCGLPLPAVAGSEYNPQLIAVFYGKGLRTAAALESVLRGASCLRTAVVGARNGSSDMRGVRSEKIEDSRPSGSATPRSHPIRRARRRRTTPRTARG